MVIPFFAFVLAMAANSQFPPWGPSNPYSYPAYYQQEDAGYTGVEWDVYGAKAHHKTHHVGHKHHK